MMQSPALSAQVFAILGALIEEKTGLHYRPDDRALLADKLAPRLAEAGFETFLDYYYFLRYDAAGAGEIDSLVDALVVGETYLFRENDQLVAMIEEVIAPRVAAGQRPRIWSAACATGEEPYSIAMLLASRGLLARTELVASDISPRALARARSGRLGRRALRHDPPRDVSGYFTRLETGELEMNPVIHRAVDFHRVSLIDADAIARLGAFDVILCRNVLIYFDDDTARRVIDGLTAALVPGGTLLVGVSESLLRLGTSLVSEERRGVFMYRRTG
jgi:chemotaxis protein methyltransferase CheR